MGFVLAGCGGGGGGSGSLPPPVVPAPPPPLVSIRQPLSEFEVAPDVVVRLEFTQDMDVASLAGHIKLTAAGQIVPTTLAYADRIATLTPNAPLALETLYTITVDTGVRNQAGVALMLPVTANFTTMKVVLKPESHAFPVAATAPPVAVGDINGDGFLDIAVAGPYFDMAATVAVRVYMGTSQGLLAEPVDYSAGTPNCAATSVGIGDVNGDGKPDVVTASYLCGLGLYLQQQDSPDGRLAFSGFVRSVADTSRKEPSWLRIADINQDGRQDVVAIGDRLTIWLQQPGGGLGPASFHDVGEPLFSGLEVGDFNGDGRPDVALAGGYGRKDVLMVPQLADGTMGEPVSYATVGEPRAIAMGDLNGDGLQDIVVTAAGEEVLLQTANGTFALQAPLPTIQIPSSVAIGDIDGNGHNDIVVMHGEWVRVGILFQEADGTYPYEYLYDIRYSSINPQGLAVVDLDGNGTQDIVVGTDNSLILYRQPD